ncbi:MAG TPA: hypothetical protein VKU83_11575 [Puia sp.]|nr:hypothetical protein [Puia sp.]
MNTPNLSTSADKDEEITALKKALEEKSEEIKRLRNMIPKWFSTKDMFPEKTGRQAYEHVDCLVLKGGYIERLMWNCEEKCWDDAEGDDYECDAEAVSHWLPMSLIATLEKP